MAVIVEHAETEELYVVVGTGFGMFQSERPSALLGNLMPSVDQGVQAVVACADRNGVIHWFGSEELTVVLVDGSYPDDLLEEAEGLVYESGEDDESDDDDDESDDDDDESEEDEEDEEDLAEADVTDEEDDDLAPAEPSSSDLWGPRLDETTDVS